MAKEKEQVVKTRIWESDSPRIQRVAEDLSSKTATVGSKEVVAFLLDLYEQCRCPQCGQVMNPTKCNHCHEGEVHNI